MQKRVRTSAGPCTKSSPPTRRRRRGRSVDFLWFSKRYSELNRIETEGDSLDRKSHLPTPTPITFTHSHHPASTPLSASEAQPQPTSLIDALIKQDKSNTALRWDEAEELLKSTFFHREISKRGGVSFTLNLGPEIEDAAKNDPKGFTVHVRRRLARILKAEFGYPVGFWFAIDLSPQGRPHLHGGIAITHNELPRLSDALRKAGGAWGKRRGAEHQIDVGTRLDDFWPRYATRNIRPKAKARFGKMLSVTDDILKPARLAFEHERAKLLASGALPDSGSQNPILSLVQSRYPLAR